MPKSHKRSSKQPRRRRPSTDSGNAALFAKLHGDEIRYVRNWNKWLVWGGQHWRLDHNNVYVTGLAKDVSPQLLREANAMSSDNLYTAQRIVDDAIKDVSTLRGRLGAFQKNILETNINSLSVALENVTASESIVRDADFATETAALTRAQILVQANTSILSLANAMPQSVLALLG